MKLITENQEKILRGLAVYKFMTAEQLYRIGVNGSAEQARKTIRAFMEAYPNLIEKVSPGVVPGVGRIPDLFFLTKDGALFIRDNFDVEFEEIKYPVGKILGPFADYFHRVSTVSCFISFRTWAEAKGYDVLFTDAYFDKVGANRGSTERSRAKTKFDYGRKYLISDGACMFDANGKRYLFLLEFYNGMDTKRVLEQLYKHAEAMADGSPSAKYKHDRGNLVAVVFETASAKTAAMTRMKAEPAFSAFQKYFIFNTLERVEADFAKRWQLFNGEYFDFV